QSLRTLEKFRLGKRWWSAEFEPTSFVAAPAGSKSFRRQARKPRRKSRLAPEKQPPRLSKKPRRRLRPPRNRRRDLGRKLKFRKSWPARWRRLFKKSLPAQRRRYRRPPLRPTPSPHHPPPTPPHQ